TFFVLTRAEALSMLRNASASEDGANLESALVFAVSLALACDPTVAPTTVANDVSRNVLRVNTGTPQGCVPWRSTAGSAAEVARLIALHLKKFLIKHLNRCLARQAWPSVVSFYSLRAHFECSGDRGSHGRWDRLPHRRRSKPEPLHSEFEHITVGEPRVPDTLAVHGYTIDAMYILDKGPLWADRADGVAPADR